MYMHIYIYIYILTSGTRQVMPPEACRSQQEDRKDAGAHGPAIEYLSPSHRRGTLKGVPRKGYF